MVGVGSTATLIGSCVPSLPLCLIPQCNKGVGVHNNGLLDDETIFVETCYVPAGASNFALLLSQMQHVVQRIFHCQKLRNLICLWCNVYSVLLCIDCSFNILQRIVLFLFEGLNGSNLLELIIAINGVKCNA